MIGTVLRPAKWLDEWLAAKLGQPYRILLGVGLVAEIAERLREFPAKLGSSGGIAREVLAILLFAALLLHQLAEFHEHVAGIRRPDAWDAARAPEAGA